MNTNGDSYRMLAHLMKYKRGLTAMEAFHKFNSLSLVKRVCDWRQNGLNIIGKVEMNKATGKRYMRYFWGMSK